MERERNSEEGNTRDKKAQKEDSLVLRYSEIKMEFFERLGTRLCKEGE